MMFSNMITDALCFSKVLFLHVLVSPFGYLIHFYSSIRWVTNHYKWIVWKLASYERCYWKKYVGKFLTVSNVLEELKYRYVAYCFVHILVRLRHM